MSKNRHNTFHCEAYTCKTAMGINAVEEANGSMKTQNWQLVQVSGAGEGCLEDMLFKPRSERSAAADSMRGDGMRVCWRVEHRCHVALSRGCRANTRD